MMRGNSLAAIAAAVLVGRQKLSGADLFRLTDPKARIDHRVSAKSWKAKRRAKANAGPKPRGWSKWA